MPATEAEIRELYERYGPIIYARCRHLMGNDEDAHDALQETFARVIHNYDDFRADSSPLTWMYRISTNWCLNQIRNSRGRQAKHQIYREDIAGSGFTDPAAGRSDNARLLRELIAGADEQTQAIVVHIYFDDMTRAEAARMVGVSQPTLRKRLDRFMRRARKVMGTSPAPIAFGLLLLLVLV